MKMNRRNALLGLGAIATGGGALFGSGAFSSVQADRTVEVTVKSDQNANLGLVANGTSNIANNTSGGGTELGINADQLNPDAITRFNAAFNIVNNASENKLVSHNGLASSGSPVDSVKLLLASDVGNDVGKEIPWSATDYVTINSNAKLVVGIEIDTQEVASQTTSQFSLQLEAAEEPGDFTFGSGGTDLGTETS